MYIVALSSSRYVTGKSLLFCWDKSLSSLPSLVSGALDDIILAYDVLPGFLVFTPVLVGGMGYTGVKANLMSVTPFIAAYVGLLAIQKSSDHFKERSLHTIASLCLS